MPCLWIFQRLLLDLSGKQESKAPLLDDAVRTFFHSYEDMQSYAKLSWEESKENEPGMAMPSLCMAKSWQWWIANVIKNKKRGGKVQRLWEAYCSVSPWCLQSMQTFRVGQDFSHSLKQSDPLLHLLPIHSSRVPPTPLLLLRHHSATSQYTIFVILLLSLDQNG